MILVFAAVPVDVFDWMMMMMLLLLLKLLFCIPPLGGRVETVEHRICL